MNKLNVGFAALALTITGCSDNFSTGTELDREQHEITFDSYCSRQTRNAIDKSHDSSYPVTSFKMYAFDDSGKPFFNNVLFSKKNGTYTSELPYFWPKFNLNFYAYSLPEMKSNVKQIINSGEKLLMVELPDSLMETEDLVAAKLLQHRYEEGQPNVLTFEHILSSVEFYASRIESRMVVRVMGVKMVNFAYDGEFDYQTMTIAPYVDEYTGSEPYKTTYVFDNHMKIELNTIESRIMGSGNAKYWYILPQKVKVWNPDADPENTKKGAYIALKIQLLTDDRYIAYEGWTAIPLQPDSEGCFTFEQGKRYSFHIKFLKNGGAGYIDPETADQTDYDPGEPLLEGGQVMGFQTDYPAWNERTDSITM